MRRKKALGALGRPFGVGLRHFSKALGLPKPNAFEKQEKSFVFMLPNASYAFSAERWI